MPAVTSLLPPRYHGPRRLAGGGMGEVYVAEDEVLGRTVAVKVLSERLLLDGDARRRLVREARAAARLSGEPHTVAVFDFGEWQGRPFIVMEYLAGGSLEDLLLRDGPQPLERTLAWLDDVAAALDHAHRSGIVHRDVKPANLLLDERGTVHVADFGIATAVGLEALTMSGTVVGTAGYLAPEQAEGRPATAASDRYALGVVAFELLTGGRPFAGESLAAEATAHLREPVPAATGRNARLPAAVDAVFARALAKDPVARYESCTELVAALRRAGRLTAPTRVIAEPAGAVMRRRSRLARTALLAGPPLLLLGGIAAAVIAAADGHTPARADPLTVTVVSSETRTVRAPAARTTPARSAIATRTLVDQGEASMAAGRYQDARAPLQQALRQLQGSGTAAEARVDLDLAVTTVQLGSCDGVQTLLQRAESIVGAQPQADELLALCTGPPGHRPGHGGDGRAGKGHGKDQGDNGG
jgi:eukaryotic-like serine/threonine-protein kinase